ncbi:hypothetical protein LJB42_003028 [Komagataella kurtzmanii]|nr:hypothetical protein LJB42_003028 [Komagataella kurtzmanii]
MSERKAINKYIPADFDPSQIRRTKKKKSTALPTVRLMAPFSMKCSNCGDYISKSKKFNARKETTKEDYLGVKIIKFHFRCPLCSGEIVFRTDPVNADYVVEKGAVRNFLRSNIKEPEKLETLEETLDRLEKQAEQDKKEELAKQKGIHKKLNDPDEDIIVQVEKKMIEQREEQRRMDELDDLRSKNARIERIKRSEISLEDRILNDDSESLEKEIASRTREAFENKRPLEIRPDDEFSSKEAKSVKLTVTAPKRASRALINSLSGNREHYNGMPRLSLGYSSDSE